MDIILGVPVMLTSLLLESQQLENIVNVLKSLYQTVLSLPHALPWKRQSGKAGLLSESSTFWLQRSWQARVEDKDLLCSAATHQGVW